MDTAKQLAFEGWSNQIQRLIREDHLTLYEEYANVESHGSVSDMERLSDGEPRTTD